MNNGDRGIYIRNSDAHVDSSYSLKKRQNNFLITSIKHCDARIRTKKSGLPTSGGSRLTSVDPR